MAFNLDADSMNSALYSLERLHDDIGQFLIAQGHEPNPGSRAASELTEYPDPESLRTAYGLGNILLDEAGDFIYGFHRLLEKPVLTFSQWALARGILEVCALSAWILDPTVSSRERIRRSLTRMYKAALEQRKFARVTDDLVLLQPSEERVGKVERKASRLGYEKFHNKKGVCIGFEKPIPSTTSLIVKYLEKEDKYRFYSAVLHGHHWAMTAIGYTASRSGNTTFVSRSVEPAIICLLTRDLVESFYIPLKNKVELFGWDFEVMEDLFGQFDSVQKQLGLRIIKRLK
jgi:hypothetical protein